MSKHTLWMSALVIGAMAAGCGGNRNDNGTQGATGTSGTTDAAGGRTMTLRGCVGEGSPGGTYVLRTAEPGKGATGTSGSGQASGSTDVSGTRPGGDQESARLYRLIPTGNLDIGRNVGKEVSVVGEIATQAQDNTGATGSAINDRTQRKGTTGEGDAGTNPQSGSSRGSGGGRVRGDAPDATAGARFFRVTSMTKVSDSCAGEK